MITVKELQKISIDRFNKCDCKSHKQARKLLPKIFTDLEKRAITGYNSCKVNMRGEEVNVKPILKNHLQYLGFKVKEWSPGSWDYLIVSWK